MKQQQPAIDAVIATEQCVARGSRTPPQSFQAAPPIRSEPVG